MNILWLSHIIPYPPKSGVLLRCYNLIKEISKYHNVTLLSFIQNDQLSEMFSSIEVGLEESREALSKICTHVEFINIPSEKYIFGKHILALKSIFTRDPYTINWLKSKCMYEKIKFINNNYNFDIVHFDTISLVPYAREFPDITKVLDHHNIESHMMLRRSTQENNLIKKAYYYQEGKKLLRYEKNHCRDFELHITCSKLDKERLDTIITNLNTHVIPNGVDIDYFQPPKHLEEKYNLIFAGSLSWYPNRDAMIYFSREIWPTLKQVIPDIVMNVVGSSPPQELLQLAKNDCRFKVHGFVDDVREYLSKASIYICPIRDGGGTKLKLLDAFAMGIPTIAHPVACEGLDVKDNYNVILADTPNKFISAVQLLINDDKLRNTISKNARSLVTSNYSFSNIGKTLSELFYRTHDDYKSRNRN